jgi:hypothetical protein
MAVIRVRGIDQDSMPRLEFFEEVTPASLALKLCRAGWKYALLERNGTQVGEVWFDLGACARVWRGEPE